MNNDIKKVQPFDSFSAVCGILVWAGYYKLNKPTTRLKRILHQIYRILALLLVVAYNLQHFIFTVQHRHDMDKLIDCMVIEIPQMNLFAKVLNMLVQKRRIDKIQEVLTGPVFAVTHEEDEGILKKNILEMNRLHTFLNAGVLIAGFLLPSSLFVKRYTDSNDGVHSYMPFKTDTWAKFALSVFFETWPILWTGYGHLAIDQLIAAYYAHAQTQLKIIEHQLQRLCTANEDYQLRNNNYRDYIDETIHKRFKQIVKRYETVVWYKNEVETAFNFPLSVQFLSTGSAVCLVIFRMTAVYPRRVIRPYSTTLAKCGLVKFTYAIEFLLRTYAGFLTMFSFTEKPVLSITSFPFVFLALLFFLLLTQVFLYCYYGNIVEIESRSINDSLYASDWLSLSPSFRRLLLVAMCRWSRPLGPRVCRIIPLSLSTFVQIIKSSYTLYTVLVVTAQPTTF